jgi:hypothetical protein
LVPLPTGRAVPSVEGGTITLPPAASALQVGRQVARAVHGGIRQ